jgi:hypothetical protein
VIEFNICFSKWGHSCMRMVNILVGYKVGNFDVLSNWTSRCPDQMDKSMY